MPLLSTGWTVLQILWRGIQWVDIYCRKATSHSPFSAMSAANVHSCMEKHEFEESLGQGGLILLRKRTRTPKKDSSPKWQRPETPDDSLPPKLAHPNKKKPEHFKRVLVHRGYTWLLYSWTINIFGIKLSAVPMYKCWWEITTVLHSHLMKCTQVECEIQYKLRLCYPLGCVYLHPTLIDCG